MTADPRAFDVFLSHNRADADSVEVVARRLRDDAGLAPFLDTWHLVPGEPWQEALEQALAASQSCAVFLGPAGLGTWDNESMRAALEQRGESPDFRVIPVLLPDARLPERGRLPPFLARLTWVDFRSGLDDQQAFEALVAGIKGVAPGAAEAADATCPFRGLQPFEEEHAAFFFGREALTQHLAEALRSDRFLAVVGPSGSGKSSLVRAGLVPRVRAGALPGSADWPVVIVKPGAQPLESLAARLLPLLGAAADPIAARGSLLAALGQDERGLHTVAQTILGAAPDSRRLLLVVDQFEELFTLAHSSPAARQLIAAVLYAATIAGGQVVAVITMRADFLGQCAAHPQLAARLKGLELVGPMLAEELRRAMVAPAERVGLRYEKGLVEHILEDLGDEPGALPLLQHTLLELWLRRRGAWLTGDAYQAIGGVRGALASRADAIYESLTPAQQEAARRVLLRLTQPGEGTEDTRRRAPLTELLPAGDRAADVQAAVDSLADARLLTVTSDEDDARASEPPVIVDVSHEALIRGWPRLRGWIDADREALRIHRQLTDAAEEWDASGREPSYLYTGARLATVLEWAQANAADINTLERAFVDASRAARDAERAAAQQRSRRQLATLAAALAAVSLALVAALVFWRQSDSNARMARAQYLATQGQVQSASGRPLLGLRLATEGLALMPPGADGQRERVAAEVVLPLALSARVASLHEDVEEWYVSPDRVWALFVSPLDEARLVRLADGAPSPWRATDGARVAGASFSPAGDALVVRYDERHGVLTWTRPGAPQQLLPAEVDRVAFSPDGALLVVRYKGYPAELRRAADGAVLADLGPELDNMAFSPDGAALIADYNDAPGAVLRSSDGTRLRELGGDLRGDRVRFSPDGALLALVYEGGRAELRTAAGEPVAELPGDVSRVSFSPGGTLLTVEYEDHTADIYRGADRALLARLDGDVDKLVLSPDEDTYVVDYNDGPGELRRASDPAARQALAGRVGNVSFSRDGSAFVVDYDSRSGELWRGGAHEQLRGEVERVMSGPDGATFVVRYTNTSAALVIPGAATQTASLGSTTRDFVYLPGGTHMAALYRDGRAYLLDLAVLRAVAAGELSAAPGELLAALCAGPLAGPHWGAAEQAALDALLAGQSPQACGQE